MPQDYYSNYAYRNGAIERIMMGSGFLQDSVYYVQIKDYQGNVRAVLDRNHNLVERNEYYPYGGLINASDNQLQPYKYSSKELDRENGLDWYDFFARMYDPTLGEFSTMDPKAEDCSDIGTNVYCISNPIRLIDIDGREPFDVFQSTDAAAKDFGNLYNGQSIKTSREIGSFIISINNNGIKYYTYILPTIGTKDNVIINEPILPNNARKEARVHTHGSRDYNYRSNEFSGAVYHKDFTKNKYVKEHDIGVHNREKIIGYLVTPNGSLRKYDYKTGRITLIDTSMPSDPKDNTRKNNINPIDLKKPTISEPSLIEKSIDWIKNIFK